jgi:hypothetical protein
MGWVSHAAKRFSLRQNFSQVPFGDGIVSPEVVAESRQAAMSGCSGFTHRNV